MGNGGQMKITKYVHSCLLVEMPDPVNRTALFDPGSMSVDALDKANLEYLDDIIITHEHQDHFDMGLVKSLVEKFPEVRITATEPIVEMLANEGITASNIESDGIVFFDAPHEDVAPMFPMTEEIGVHYLDQLTHPGDSHSFTESKAILALPMTAPWGSTVEAVNLAIRLKPQYVLPIHDWHWRDEAREQMYGGIEQLFASHDIKFMKLETGEPVVLEV
jgi:L-ascorbate metabolism protein UlaG (beta-lactamase superfamily)